MPLSVVSLQALGNTWMLGHLYAQNSRRSNIQVFKATDVQMLRNPAVLQPEAPVPEGNV